MRPFKKRLPKKKIKKYRVIVHLKTGYLIAASNIISREKARERIKELLCLKTKWIDWADAGFQRDDISHLQVEEYEEEE